MSRTTTEIFNNMEALLLNPASWTQFELAKDAAGHVVSPFEQTASCFCTLGAKRRALGPEVPLRDVLSRDVNNRLAAAVRTLFPERVSDISSDRLSRVVSAFNDDPLTTHDDVLSVIRLARAI